MRVISDEMIKQHLRPSVRRIIVSLMALLLVIATQVVMVGIDKKLKTHYQECGTFVNYIIHKRAKRGKEYTDFNGFIMQTEHQKLHFKYYHDFHQHLNLKKRDLQAEQKICAVYFKPTFRFLHGDVFLVDLRKDGSL